MANALISLGANLDDRAATIQQAMTSLATHTDIEVASQSELHGTTPVGGPAAQGEFLNAAALLKTSLTPVELLRALQDIENQLGRERHARWAARNIDLDLLLYDDVVLATDELTLPHPRMSFRRFVIEPAAEIAAEMVHPQLGWTIGQLREHLRTHPPYVAIAGPIGVGKSHLAERLCTALGATFLPEHLPHDRLAAFYAQATPPETSATDASSATGLNWATEIEFLQQRAQQLQQGDWPSESTAISDYWFDQSLAFAQVWLPADQHDAYRAEWEATRASVVSPKLLVVLDAPVEALQRAIAERGRPYEAALSAETLSRLRESLLSLVDQGPVLRLRVPHLREHGDTVSKDREAASELSPFDEVAAAIEAMQ